MNQFNAFNVGEPNGPPRECNSQTTVAHFKYRSPPPKTSPVVSDIMGRLNHHTIDNGDVEVHPSYFSVEYNSESVTDPDTTPIKSFDDDEMNHILELFHSEHQDDLLDADLYIIKD